MIIKRNQFIINGLFFISLLICVFLSSIKVFSYVSVCVFISYWIYLYHFNKTYFVKYLAFIFVAVGTVVGAVIIELFPEQYLIELVCQSHFSGSLPLLIFSYWIFLFVLELREYHYGKSIEIRDDSFSSIKGKKIINILSTVSGLLLLALFLYMATHTPSSFTLKIDRYSFGETYKMPKIISMLQSYSYLLLVFPILALIYANRLISAIGIISYIAYNFWIGEKFGAFFTLMCMLLIVLYNKILTINKKKLKKYMKKIFAVFLLMVFLAVLIIYFTTNLNPYEYFTRRTVQQGQLWWKTYDLYGGEIHPTEFENEINAFIEGDKANQDCIGAKNGIYKVMYLCAPESMVSVALLHGSRYTQADYAVMYYYFGIPGVMVYSVLMGLIISSIVNSFISALKNKDYIKAMIYLRFFMLIRVSFSMFTFGTFIDAVSILSYIYLIFTHGIRLKFGFHRNLKSQIENGENNVKQQY